VNGIAFNQGQVPSAGSRVLVQEPVAEELLERLRTRTAALRVGDPLDRNTDVGAVHSAQQLDRLTELVRSGVSEGARRWTSPCPLPDKGFFFAPTIFTGVQQSMRIAREEIRGPVVSVLTFRTPQEAVNKVNNTPY
ncbi:aldehyde dehydrogenase family protein, partial [Klebsiella pneumoniae]|nr:aldehyde dehydrogenase family protein [Klebsiella pneumoniae]